MEIIGKQLEFGVALESSRGTAKTVAEKWIRNVSAGITEKAEHATDDNSHAVMADSDNRRLTKKWVEGDLECIVDADAVGFFFYNLFGSVSSSVVAGSVYSHDFTMDNSTPKHPSLTFFAKDGGVQQLVFSNGMVGSLELSASIDDFVRMTASLMAKDATDNSDTTDYETQYDFVGKDIEIKIADTEGGLSGATATKIKELSVTLDKGAIMDYILGNYTPDDIYASKMSIEGSITKNLLDETFKDLNLDDTSKYMQIKITGSQDIGSGNNPEIKILLNNVRITNWERSGGNDELVTEEIEFKAFYNDSDSQQAKITLQNLTTEYDSYSSA